MRKYEGLSFSILLINLYCFLLFFSILLIITVEKTKHLLIKLKVGPQQCFGEAVSLIGLDEWKRPV